MRKIKSTQDLRTVLSETIDDVRHGVITSDKAKAVSDLTGRVLQSAELDLKFMKFNKKARPMNGTHKLIDGK